MKDVFKTFHSGRAVFFILVFISFIFAVAVLKIASTVILPFTIAILLAFVMYPLVKLLDKLKIPRFVSILLIVVIIGIGLYIFGVVLFTSGRSLLSLYAKYYDKLSRIIENIAHIAQQYGISYDDSISVWANMWGQLQVRDLVFKYANSMANTSFKFLSGFASSAIMVIISVVFILLESGLIKKKFEVSFENQSERINQIGQQLMSQVTRYLTAKFYISLGNGIVFAVLFRIIGMEFAIVWGVLQFVLNFIPTLGSIVAGICMSLFALIQFWPSPGPIILVIVFVLVLNIISGYILDPKIIGDHVGISPLFILVSLAIWGYIWGFAGMIIAVPMTVIIKIICENIPILEPISVIISSRKSVDAKKNSIQK